MPKAYDPVAESSPDHEIYRSSPNELVLIRFGDACHCGCGQPTRHGSRFCMGHDMRLKGKLTRAHLAGVPVSVVTEQGTTRSSAADLAATYSTDRLDWVQVLKRAEVRLSQDLAGRVARSEQELLALTRVERPGLRLVRVGRWKHTGYAMAIYDAGDQLVFEYVDRSGALKQRRKDK